jgi:hypothetical protein
LAKIFRGFIKYWNDPLIELLNPGLSNLFKITNSNTEIEIVVCCSDVKDDLTATNPFVMGLNFTNSFKQGIPSITYPMDWNPIIKANNKTGFTMVTTEKRMQTTVERTEGSIGYKLVESAVRNKFTDISMINIADDGTKTTVAATPETLLACTDAIEPSTTDYSFNCSTIQCGSQQCWPFMSLVSTLVRTKFTGEQCERANKTLTMVKWLLDESHLTEAAYDRGIVRMLDVPAVHKLVMHELHSVTCDGETMLITLPKVWSLSGGIRVFTYIFCVIGLIAVTVSMTLLFAFRTHPVMRAASVPFMAVILSGLALMLIAPMFLVLDPSDSTCGVMNWFVNLGFSCCFAPLFAKMWRIYKIFDRKKLQVTKISNKKLGLMVAGIICIDVLLLSIWQGLSPLRPMLDSRIENGRINEYTMCSTNGDGISILIVLSVGKGLMLLFGSIMGFSTRKVSSTFNESNNVAWAVSENISTKNII